MTNAGIKYLISTYVYVESTAQWSIRETAVMSNMKQTNKEAKTHKPQNAKMQNVSRSNHNYYFSPLFISMWTQQPNGQL